MNNVHFKFLNMFRNICRNHFFELIFDILSSRSFFFVYSSVRFRELKRFQNAKNVMIDVYFWWKTCRNSRYRRRNRRNRSKFEKKTNVDFRSIFKKFLKRVEKFVTITHRFNRFNRMTNQMWIRKNQQL